MAIPKEVTITWGPETYHMGNFSSFKVGPISLTLALTPGEPFALVYQKAIALLTQQSEKLFVAQRNAFQERYPSRG